jgi:hypothetical protein
MRLFYKIATLLGVVAVAVLPVRAQMANPSPTPAYEPLSDTQLDQLLGPIALYPDPLLSQMLPASTFPAQIVLADRYLLGGGDPNQIDQQPWDPSVQAVARYPTVLKWMDDNLNQTTELGQAFLNQQQAMMASIQRLRTLAYNLGNLQSTPQQQVTNDDGNIEIDPVDGQDLYVPVYQPNEVYYDQSNDPSLLTFGDGYPVGGWLDDDFDWEDNDIVVWDRGYSRSAYGRHESHGQREDGHTTVWRPGAAMANRGDRGWDNAPAPDAVSSPSASQLPQQELRASSTPRFTPAPIQYATPVSRPEANGAFIGSDSSRDARIYSDRGQQSMGAISRSAPTFQPAAPGGGSRGGGGGGGRR